ncbi:MAG: sigma-70 family RNA polymerase sigma factor [Anaerolineae bacterium]|jgi:RNA polymerase sigma-70 factor (ECF subfamily)|nr:sigma-70 family RNA polymerase sigma factor [Anaerolineae bacterium]
MTETIKTADCINDVEFVKMAQAGNVRGFAHLHGCHWQAIYTYFFYRVNDTQTAEDLASEVFVRLVTAIDSYCEKRATILPWLYTIARNLLTDHYRKNSGQPELVEVEESILSTFASPEQDINQQMDTDCLKKAMRTLTEEQQQVIIGKFIEGRSNREVATLIQRTEGAVKSLQHRALAALRRVIEKAGCYEI